MFSSPASNIAEGTRVCDETLTTRVSDFTVVNDNKPSVSYLHSYTSTQLIHYWTTHWLTEHGLTSAPTQYRPYGRQFLQVKRPNQQYTTTMEYTHSITAIQDHWYLITEADKLDMNNLTRVVTPQSSSRNAIQHPTACASSTMASSWLTCIFYCINGSTVAPSALSTNYRLNLNFLIVRISWWCHHCSP